MSQPPPSLQTVATLTGGTSPVMQQAFFWGIPGRPFSVGSHGDWVVNGPGVEPLHFFLNFDGRMVLVASGPSGAPVTVGGSPIDHIWRAVPVFAEIAFGGCRIRITCEDAPQPAQPAQPAQPGQHTQPTQPAQPAQQTQPAQRASVPPPNPASFEAPVQTPQTLDRTAYLRPRPLKTQPLALTPEQIARAQAAAAPQRVSDGAAPRYTPSPPGNVPAHGYQPPPAAPTVHSAAPPGFAPGAHSPALAGMQPVLPRTVQSSPPPGLNATTRSAAPPPGPMGAGRGSGPAPAAAPGVVSPDVPLEEGVASTMSDAGALRALAARVQTDPSTSSTTHAAAYFAEVQRAWVDQSIPPAAGSPAPGQRLPSAPPNALGTGAPRPTPSAPPPGAKHGNAGEDPDLEGKKPGKERTSWTMRLVLVLLPVAGYFAIFWEPPAPAPAPSEDASAATEATSSPTGSAASAPSANAPARAPVSAAVPSGLASVAGAAPSSSGPVVVPLSSGEAVAPSPAPPLAKAARPDRTVPGAQTSASGTGGAPPLSPRLAQQALNAAFEGRLSEALERYEKLAAGPDGETYRVSARLIRERAIRKP
jgi:hypothetical protein